MLNNQAGRAPARDQWWIWDMAPADFATGVAATAAPRVTFQRVLDPTSVDASTVRLVHGRTGAAVAATPFYDPATNTVTLEPDAALEEDTPYQIVVGAVRDRTDTVYTGRFTTTFRTALPAAG